MDILGKEGEKAREELEEISRQVQELASHLDAVDAALNDFIEDYQKVREQKKQEEEKDDQSSEIREEISELREKVSDNEDRQRMIEERTEKLESGLIDTVADLKDEIRETVGKLQKVDDIEDRLEEMENNFVLEVNSREYDFERKLDAQEFERRERDIYEELRKLRTSVNVLAEEMDKKDDIEIE